MLTNLWEREKNHREMEGLEALVYRSRLLGKDRTVCNWGGGNTSMKTVETDFTGRPVRVLWVKGSGSDLASATERSFTALRLDDVLPLMDRESMTDEEMVAYLSHCMMNPAHPRASIETLLHAFLPYPHVDHTHPDAIISICCAAGGRRVAQEIFGDRHVWVPYVRPGFSLSKMIAEAVAQNPGCELVLMEKHGLVTWGDTAEASYHQTLRVIQEAETYIARRLEQSVHLFGGSRHEPLSPAAKRDLLRRVLPAVRGAVSQKRRMIVTFDEGDDVLTFVNSRDARSLSQVGAACPDHLVHTKRVPLFVDWDPAAGTADDLARRLTEGIAAYEREYIAYFDRHRAPGDEMADPAPRVILIPGVGMLNTGKSWQHANISAQLYHRAIAVMKGTSVLDDFVSLDEAESYQVEYWPLELYKLTLAPAERELSRQVGLVTGGAGGIGSAICRKLVDLGMHVVVADLNLEGARQLALELNEQYGPGRATALQMDVTKLDQVENAYAETVLQYGGLDILVNNAGLSTSSPFEETSLDEWNLNMNVLATGYFLVAREAYKVMKPQGTGGAMVFIGSKNSIFAGKNASAYSTAKAAEVHLARCIAAEGGESGIRVNSVLPDAVLQGSQIWNSSWREARAATYGISPDELEEHYRKRTVLQRNVVPDDIAEAVAFLVSDRSAKTTGCMITVDGGVAAAFTR